MPWRGASGDGSNGQKGQGAMAIEMPVGGVARAGEWPDQTGRTVAFVDLRHAPGAPHRASDATDIVFESALREIEQAVRGEDRVCPFGTARVAVAFGPDADTVSPRTLGERLARAVRQSAVLDSESVERLRRIPGADGASHPGGGPLPSSPTVTVDRMIGWVASADDPLPGTNKIIRSRIPSLRPGPTPGLWYRTVVRSSSGGFARYGTRRDDIVPGDRGTILVVSPCRTSGSAPGLSSVAASAMAERLGYEVGTVALCCDDELVLDVWGSAVELVILVIEGEREPTSDRTTWASSTWHIPAQLAARFCSQGIRVLAVGAGGGAGALASCVAQGAAVVLDLDELQAELSHAAEAPTVDNSWDGLVGGDRIPQPMEALVLLTASERRVLFFLTTGRSAQDIADDLVVSVTTVRSHIRSILRKLGVRSQLAAVAIANSQDFERHQPSGAMSHVQRELEAPGVA
jgi:DNA-binding NarL/FixJ family response regulator